MLFLSVTAARSNERSIWLVACTLGGAPAVVPSCPGGAAECQRLSLQSQSLDLAAALRPLLFLCKGGGRRGSGRVPAKCSPVIEVASFRQKMDKQKCCYKSRSEAKALTGSFLFLLLHCSSITWTLSGCVGKKFGDKMHPVCQAVAQHRDKVQPKEWKHILYSDTISPFPVKTSLIFTICRTLSFLWMNVSWNWVRNVQLFRKSSLVGERRQECLFSFLNRKRINLQLPECIGTVAPQSYTHWLAAGPGDMNSNTTAPKHQPTWS